jgi:hypothetical protein
MIAVKELPLNDQQFYPTPLAVARTMLEKLNIVPPLLEPSAGSGRLLSAVLVTKQIHKDDCFLCEIDDNLNAILKHKEYNVIGKDFLELNTDRRFKTIIMNPPFRDGIDHLFKAWELLDDGGEMCCLLNAESILSPSTKPRQRLAELIITWKGYVEILGPVFSTGDRPTDVNVVAIWLKKPSTKDQDYFQDCDFEMPEKEVEWGNEEIATLAKSNQIDDLVSRYNATIKILERRHKEQELLDQYLKDIESAVGHYRWDQDPLKNPDPLDKQIEMLKSRFWNTLFTRTKLGERVTENYRKKFDKAMVEQAQLAFTKKNINEMLMFFFCNQSQIMTDCILNVFDQVTKYHQRTIAHDEGWKTNKSARLNKKIIYPYGVKYQFNMASVNYSCRDLLDDIDKMCCFISGQNLDLINTSYSTLYDHVEKRKAGHDPFTTTCESTYFRIRCYKKGTIHLEFLDTKICEEINKIVASVRDKEIGPDY